MRTLILTVLIALTLLAPGVAGAEPDVTAQVRDILETRDDRRSVDTVRKLRRLGPEALPALLAAHRRFAARQDADQDEDDRAGTRVDVLERAILSHRSDVLERHVQAYVRANPGTAGRLDALQTLALFGQRSALALAIDVVAGMDRSAHSSHATVTAWERVLHTLLEDRVPVTRLLHEWRRVPAALQVPTARILAERDTRSYLSAVLSIVERAEDEQVPDLLGVLGSGSPVILAKMPVLGALLPLRDHRSRNIRLASARLMGRIGNTKAFSILVEMLEDDDGSVRRAARASLEHLTGASAGSSADAWRTWRLAEQVWRKESNVGGRLQSKKPVEVARALRELAKHPFVADKEKLGILRVVDRGNDGVRLLALATLERMNRAAVAPDLVRHLSGADGTFRNAIWKALRKLSGEDLPNDPRAWSEAAKRWRN